MHKNADAQMIDSVKIGTTTWSKKNLDVSTYANGDTIRQITNISDWVNAKEGAWCWYQLDESFREYGKYYNAYAVNDPRGLAPKGYHIPTLKEARQLGEYINLLNNTSGGRTIGWEAICEKGTQHWEAGKGTDEIGFNLFGGGIIDNDDLESKGGENIKILASLYLAKGDIDENLVQALQNLPFNVATADGKTLTGQGNPYLAIVQEQSNSVGTCNIGVLNEGNIDDSWMGMNVRIVKDQEIFVAKEGTDWIPFIIGGVTIATAILSEKL